jgi:Spy/CpxP family protein refolding chaperone
MPKTWQVVLATIAIFAAGLVTGGATALGIVKWVSRHPGVAPGGLQGFGGRFGQGQQFGPQLMRSFANRLDLTDDQRSRIGAIVKRTASQLARDRHEVQLTSALAIEKMQDEIADILTADQRTKFEALIAEQRARLEQFRRSRFQQTSPVPAPASPTPPK